MRIHSIESNAGGKLDARNAARTEARAAARGNRPVADRVTVGLIVGNRGFFPGHLARSGREEMLKVLASEGIDVIALGPEDSVHGAVESRDEAKALAALFRAGAPRAD